MVRLPLRSAIRVAPVVPSRSPHGPASVANHFVRRGHHAVELTVSGVHPPTDVFARGKRQEGESPVPGAPTEAPGHAHEGDAGRRTPKRPQSEPESEARPTHVSEI